MKHSKGMALLIAVVLCLSMFFSLSFIVMEADHACEGEQCHICLEIGACVSLLGSLGLAVLCFSAVLTLCILGSATQKKFANRGLTYTLVSLKVKLTI